MKGSWVDRKTKGPIKASTCLKDENFKEYKKKTGRNLVKLNNFDRLKMISGVRKDCEFLRKVGLMDYSLLLCIEKKVEKKEGLYR